MTPVPFRKPAALVPALLLAGALAACGGSDGGAEPDTAPDEGATDAGTGGAPSSEQDAGAAEVDTGADEVADGVDGRAFDSTDDAVIEAIETAMESQGAKAEWDGKVLRVSLDGSVEDLTAGLYCSTPEALIADDESAVFVYADGELHCDEQP